MPGHNHSIVRHMVAGDLNTNEALCYGIVQLLVKNWTFGITLMSMYENFIIIKFLHTYHTYL